MLTAVLNRYMVYQISDIFWSEIFMVTSEVMRLNHQYSKSCMSAKTIFFNQGHEEEKTKLTALVAERGRFFVSDS